MKKLTFLRATIGAAAIVALGATAAFAVGPTNTVSVTVVRNASTITLTANDIGAGSCSTPSYALAPALDLHRLELKAMVNANCTYTLDYTTEWATSNAVQVTASDSTAGVDLAKLGTVAAGVGKIRLEVTSSGITGGGVNGNSAGSATTANVINGSATDLITGVDGNTATLTDGHAALAFAVSTGNQAFIGASAWTLTYSVKN